MSRKLGRKSVVGVALLALFGTAAHFGAKRFFPIQYSEIHSRWELWRGGVRSSMVAGLQTYERDHCGNSPACACVFLIHGLGDTALTWKRMLLMPGEPWSKPVRLVAVNLPGAGESPRPEDPAFYRVRRQAEAVNEVLIKTEGCATRIAAGNSLGGWIAAWMALERPELVNHLVLVNAAGLQKFRNAAAPQMLSQPTVESLKEFQKKAYFKPRPIPEHVWERIAALAAKGNSRAVSEAQLPADDLDSSLGEIRTPTLVFWGRADGIIPVAAGEEMARRIPGARLHVQEECGHLPQKECLDALIAQMGSFR